MRVVNWIEPVTPVTAVMVHRHRPAGTAINWAATTYCGHGCSPAGRRNGDNMNGDNCGQNGDNESLYLQGLKMWLRNYYVAYEFVVCVTTKNAELFFNAIPIEKSYSFSYG